MLGTIDRDHVTRILDGRVRALERSGENMPRKLGAHSGHESCNGAPSIPEKKIPALVRAGIEVAEDTRFELANSQRQSPYQQADVASD